LEAGKAVRRCEQNGVDKKFVTQQPLPRTNGWSEGDSAKPQGFNAKNGFLSQLRSQKIPTLNIS